MILRQFMNTQDEVEDFHVNLFLQYLTKQGYFNVLRQESIYACFRIPNKEIEKELAKRIISTRFYKYE